MFAHGFSHPCHFQRSDHPSEVIMIRLNDIETAIGQQPAKGMDAMLLFASRNRNGNGIGHLLGPIEPIVEHGLFEIAVAVFLEELAYANRFVHIRVIAVDIGIHCYLIAEGFSNQANDGFGSAGRTLCIQVLGHEHERTTFIFTAFALLCSTAAVMNATDSLTDFSRHSVAW